MQKSVRYSTWRAYKLGIFDIVVHFDHVGSALRLRVLFGGTAGETSFWLILIPLEKTKRKVRKVFNRNLKQLCGRLLESKLSGPNTCTRRFSSPVDRSGKFRETISMIQPLFNTVRNEPIF